MNLTLFKLREGLRANLWFVPGLCLVVALVAAEVLLAIDRRTGAAEGGWLVFGGDASSAQTFLQAVATSMVTIAAVLFSVTMLVLQQANTQLSARVMRSFLRDPGTQIVLGVFLGTFVYALFVLWEIEPAANGEGFVPSISIIATSVLVLLSVALFIFYIHHMAQSIRPTTIIGRVGEETHQEIDHLYPGGVGDEPERPVEAPEDDPSMVIAASGHAGVLNGVDERHIEALAEHHGCVLGLVPTVGDYIREGAPLFYVWGSSDVDEGEANKTVSLTRERSMEQDAAFGFRQLVDIAVHALSPSQSDPTTAIQVLDQIHTLLGRLLTIRFPATQRVNPRGELRMILPRPDWDDYVRLGLDEIRQHGGGSIQVIRRLRYLLEDLLADAPGERRPALEEQLRLLELTVEQGPLMGPDRESAQYPSRQGHGPV